MAEPAGITVHLVDGTYELFRHHFGALRGAKDAAAADPNSGPKRGPADTDSRAGTRGVVASVLGMLEGGATHVGVATDHVVESFRNDLWATYKSSAGMPEELLAQFLPLEDALRALGVTVWAMVELEADDGLASAAAVAAADPRVDQVVICTPDKDLGQAVVGERVVQLDRRKGTILDEAGVVEKFGVPPASVPDYLALVGDSADGYPGIPGWGARTASTVLAHYGRIDAIPDSAAEWDPAVRAKVRGADRVAADLAAARPAAELFRTLATLRIDTGLVGTVDEWRWRGASPEFAAVSADIGAPGLAERARRLADARHA